METSPDTYLVLDKPGISEIKIKGSRFLAEAIPVSSVEEADAALLAIKKRDYDATHHCSAYRIGSDGNTFRYNDDGEPNSSAGLPIYRQIEGRNLTNSLVVVIRYYGGTKLGTGGLVRAYGEAASLALDAAQVKEIIPRTALRFVFDYDDTSPAMHTISQFDVIVLETSYSERTSMTLDIRSSQVDAFRAVFLEALGGRGDELA
ncbi:YigZ family protein [bacterium]|nr:YigZ family protein [bacterium]